MSGDEAVRDVSPAKDRDTDSSEAASSAPPSEKPVLTKSKTDSSLYYFFKSTPQDEAHKYAPQKLEKGAPGDVAPGGGEEKASGASAWNAAGTWEERDLTEWSKNRLKEIFKNVSLKSGEGEDVNVSISRVSNIDGHACLIHVRGKKRIGYELDIKLRWKGTVRDTKVAGTVHFAEVCDDEDDYEYTIDAEKSDAEHSRCKGVVKSNIPLIKSLLKQFIVELKDK